MPQLDYQQDILEVPIETQMTIQLAFYYLENNIE